MDKITGLVPATPSPTQEELNMQAAYQSWIDNDSANALSTLNTIINRNLGTLQERVNKQDCDKYAVWIYTVEEVLSEPELTTVQNCHCPKYSRYQWLVENYNKQFPTAIIKLSGINLADDGTFTMKFQSPAQQ